MDAEFWQERWDSGQTHFHQPQVNTQLQTLWPQLGVPAGAGVLVPLCGKSLDMGWLAGQGHRVVGVELAERAAADFFAEQELAVQGEPAGAFKRFAASGVEVLVGDVFDLGADNLAGVGGLYDRAALIALPPDMRARYVDHLGAIVPAGTRGLVISMEYVEGDKSGPPHHVGAQEVEQLYAAAGFGVSLMETGPDMDAPPPLQAAGLVRLRERFWRIER